MKTFQITTRGGVVHHKGIANNERDLSLSGYSIISRSGSQNSIRREIGILLRMRSGRNGLGRIMHVINDLYDIAVCYDEGKYSLWAYSNNWQGRSSYYAGIIHAYNTLRPRRKR